ncbi:MAG: hypothetical protein KDA89_19555, partial [Planctomycetaceae bacterium]|nr:hypothetical protein [Planctomycetaceae bacterium]
MTQSTGGSTDYFAQGGTAPELTFTLDSLQAITDLVVWGFHFDRPENNEAAAFTVEFSTDNGRSFGNAVMVTHNRTESASEIIPLGGTFVANAVRVTVTDNHFGNDAQGETGGDRVGLGEVRFLLREETDQRQGSRTHDLAEVTNADGTDGTDIGAFEMQDAADTVSVSVADVVANEGDGTLVFSVTLSNALPAGQTVTVVFAANAGGTASAGDDFTAVIGHPLTFQAGESLTQTVSVSITDDPVAESTETVQAVISNVSGPAVLNVDTATGTITDNDTAVFTVDDVTVNEAAGTATFTVSLSNLVDVDTTIDVSYTADTASVA